MKLFAYINIDNPMVAWEVAIGRIKSVGYIYNNELLEISLWEYDLLRNFFRYGQSQRMSNEIQLEFIRNKKYKNCVSRMKCLYFFKSKNDALFALKHWDINLNEDYISEIEVQADRITMVDSEWITEFIDKKSNENWMDNYWQGKICNKRPLYEILVDGFGVIKNDNLRRKAYFRIYELWPYSTRLLSWAICAFQEKRIDTIAKIIPGIYFNGKNVKGGYLIDIDDVKKYENEILESMDISMKKKMLPPIKVPPDPNYAFILPDLRYLEIDFSNSYASTLFQKIHKN
jgi:hypothetical protein